MDEQGFDFRAPRERRPARKFEPPPWERDQFERLAKERAERETAEKAARSALEAPAPAKTVEASVGESLFEPPAVDPASGGDRQIEAMMAGLKAEEPSALASTGTVTLMSATVLVAVGFVLLVWGVAEAVRSLGTPIGALSAGVLVLFGMGFGGAGAWLVFRTLRQRGEL